MRPARTAAEWGFDRHDARRLRASMAHAAEVRLFRRVQAVRLVCEGGGVAGAARVTGMSPWAVYKWVGRYLRGHDPRDLADDPRSGRPAAAAAITDARIRRELARDPLR